MGTSASAAVMRLVALLAYAVAWFVVTVLLGLVTDSWVAGFLVGTAVIGVVLYVRSQGLSSLRERFRTWDPLEGRQMRETVGGVVRTDSDEEGKPEGDPERRQAQ